STNFVVGARMIVWGLFKKVIFADYCAVLVDRVYADPAAFDGWSTIVATYAFTIQLYCDFSAYSEIARGSARIFGVSLMQNFDQPYVSASVADFWRRWHISLGTWIRDYLYIPLGGGRKGKARALLNVIITMFLCGLWHGAGWNFICWGLYTGATLVGEALIVKRRCTQRFVAALGRAQPVAGWFVTLHLFIVGLVIFRSESLANIPMAFARIGQPWASLQPPNGDQALLVLFFALFVAGSYLSRRFQLFDRIHHSAALSTVFYAVLIAVMLLFAKPDGPQFIYFQF
ncbi:MAG TPA: MBOAT family protein, partial [Candidatus Hydrogenedentes bacterium]|nr:MBOAT family protein [Candidatus Hydrogenedentota bacterium]